MKRIVLLIVKSCVAAASAALTFTVLLVSGVVTTPAQAQTFTDLYSFAGGTDGNFPVAGLIQDAKGNLYGTTSWGGGTGCSGYGCGTVFKVDTSGTETVLYSFTMGTDGGNPSGDLVRDDAGNLYGTASSGGAHNAGTVFKLSKAGKLTVLYSFTGGTTDGCNPYVGLLRDKAGTLYGTTFDCGASGDGTVFKLGKGGKETVLHSFTGSDGKYPYYTDLLMDAKGNLYGVTEFGGTSNNGVVYKLSKSGTLKVLHSFAGGTTDGCYPFGTLAIDKNYNLYGTTYLCGNGGPYSGYGVVFKVSKTGTETVLHNFVGGSSDGISPFGGVILGANGTFYGTTIQGGGTGCTGYGCGTVYKLDKKGVVTVLHSFSESDGNSPFGSLIRNAKGTFYGTTKYGGGYYGGTVWELTP